MDFKSKDIITEQQKPAGAAHEAEAGKHAARAMGAPPLTYASEKAQQGFHVAAAAVQNQVGKIATPSSEDGAPIDPSKFPGAPHEAEAGKHAARAMGADPLTYVSEKVQQGFHSTAAVVVNQFERAKSLISPAPPASDHVDSFEQAPVAAPAAAPADASKPTPLAAVGEKITQGFSSAASVVQNQLAAAKNLVVGETRRHDPPREALVPLPPEGPGAPHEAEAGKHAARALGADPLTYVSEKAQQLYHSSAAVVVNQIDKVKKTYIHPEGEQKGEQKGEETIPDAPPLAPDMPPNPHVLEANRHAVRATGADPLTFIGEKIQQGYHAATATLQSQLGKLKISDNASDAPVVPVAPPIPVEPTVEARLHSVEADKHAARATGADPVTFISEKAQQGYHAAAAGLTRARSAISSDQQAKVDARSHSTTTTQPSEFSDVPV